MTINRRTGIQSSSKLISGPSKQRKKNWNFEQLEARHLMTGNPVADPYDALSQDDMDGLVASAVSATSASGVLPNDPYLGYQWHLINTGQIVGDAIEQDIYGVPGEDINVAGAWALGYTGRGVVVAVVDSGVQLDHPDLAANISTTLGYDAINDYEIGDVPPFGFNLDPGEADKRFAENAHGTAIAGILAAVGNNGIGGAGVAYNATLVPVRLIDVGATDEAIARAVKFQNEQIDIYNHSWGLADPSRAPNGPNGPQDPILQALRISANDGRGGLGNIHVFASGNNAGQTFASPLFLTVGAWDYAGYSGYVNSRHTIAVTGVDHDGQYNNVDGTYTNYPETSASVLIAAPTGSYGREIGNTSILGSGLWTTDFYNPLLDPNNPVTDPSSPLYNPLLVQEGYNGPTVGIEEPYDESFDRFADPSYTSRANGTSSSAPQVSGVIALMLEANPNLSYRDVQNILIRSARQNAQFEDLGDGLSQGTYGLSINNTWVTNRNEFFHNPDSMLGLGYRGDDTINDLELFDDSRTDIARDFQDSAIGSAATVVYNPLLVPDGFILGPANDSSPVVATNLIDPNMFATGAGFTVSMGRGEFGTGVGYGHGVVDAELAVKLAAQWTEYLPDELTWTIAKQQPAAAPIGGEEIAGGADNLVIPGRFDSFNQASATDPAYSETPAFPDGTTFSYGDDFLPVVVPRTLTTDPSQGFNSNMVVEWVELRLSNAVGSYDDLRITLVSPDGTHSELTNYFDLEEGDRTYQFDYAADLVGVPTGGGSATASDWTFSTNRHWGERSDNTIAIDPSTGEPYPVVTTTVDPITGEILGQVPERSWQVHFESFGGADTVIDYELIFHGSPLDPETKRIQGFVGVDEFRADQYDIDGDGDLSEVLQDGVFNFDRWIQYSQDIYNATNIEPTDDDMLDQATSSRQNIFGINSGNSTTAVERFEDPETGEVFYFPTTIASESLANGEIEFNRLGEVERLLDVTQEQFAENVTVQLFREIADGQGGTSVETTPYRSFITGDDGNYYFDVVPPVDEANAIVGDVVSYLVRVADGEGRQVLSEDAHAPVADPDDPEALHFMPKYKGEWRVTDDYFYAWDRYGRRPEFITEENPDTGDIEYLVPIIDASGAPGAFDAAGLAVTAMVTNLGSGGEIFGEGHEFRSLQSIRYVNELGEEVQAYDEDGAPQLVDATGAPIVILNWDPTPSGFNAQQYLALSVDPTDPNGGLTVSDPDGDYEYTLDGETGLIMGTPTDPEANDPTEIVINGDWSHVVTTIPDDGDPEEDEVDGLLEIYDQAGQLVTVEQDEGGNYYFVSVSNIRTDLLFTPAVDMYDLDGSAALPIYNPATVYDTLTDADGTPLLWGGDSLFGGLVEDDVRGINFLLSSGSSPEFQGRIYTDANGDRAYNPASGDVAKSGVLVYADLNEDGAFQLSTEPFSVSDTNGLYSVDMSGLDGPRFVEFRVENQPGFTLVSPSGGTYLEYVSPTNLAGESFDFVFEVGGGGGSGGGAASVTGQVFHDTNMDGVKNFNEFGVSGVTVFADANGNGVLDDGERRTTTNDGGVYELSLLTTGSIDIAVSVESPLVQTTPFNDQNGNGVLDPGEGSRTINAQSGVVSSGVSFGVVSLAGRDWGDLADFPTLASEGGAWHQIIAGVRLGAAIDGEVDGQPSSAADGDDLDGDIDDEDGVVPRFGADGVISDGEEFGFTVTTAGTGYFLNAWIDFNGDGDWDDAGEHVYNDIDLNPGTWVAGVTTGSDGKIALPTITAPDVAEGAALAARFRWGVGGLGYSGGATIGEVEDYVYQASLNAVFLPAGDYDGNSVVDDDDYLVWRSSYGQTGPDLAADGNGDGRVDAADYSVWRDNLGAGEAVAEAASSTSLIAAPYHQVPFSPEQLAALGVEVLVQKIGAGANARYVPVYRIIDTGETVESTVAATPEEAVVAALSGGSTASSDAVEVGAVTDQATATWVVDTSARPTRSLPSVSLDSGEAELVAAADRASDLDLYFAEIDVADEEDSLEFVSFAPDEEVEEVEALALALADDELNA